MTQQNSSPAKRCISTAATTSSIRYVSERMSERSPTGLDRQARFCRENGCHPGSGRGRPFSGVFLEHDAEKCVPVFGKTSCSKKKKSHFALAGDRDGRSCCEGTAARGQERIDRRHRQ